MTSWMRRIRGALGMGLSWALAWAIGGLVIGAASLVLPLDWFLEVFDAPLPALALPGFIAGALFSLVLGVAARTRRFSELSMPRFALWGVLGGVLLTLFPIALMTLGLGTPGPKFWPGIAVAAGPLILFSAGSAAATLAIARRGENRAAIDGVSVNYLDRDRHEPPPKRAPQGDIDRAH